MADVLITRYPRGFSVDTADYDVRRELEMYNETLIQPKLAPSRGQVEVVDGDKYFIYEETTDKFYYIDALYQPLLNVIDSIKRRLGVSRSMDVKIVELQTHDGDVVEFDRHTLNIVEDEGSDYVYQNDVVPHISREGHHHNVLELQTGKGKALANPTPIKIPQGWKPIGDLEVGDRVIAPDGTMTNVIAVYPQGEVELYTVLFEDGRVIDCCKEHLWEVFVDGNVATLPTYDIITHLSNGSDVRIPLCVSEASPTVKLARAVTELLLDLKEDTLTTLPKEFINASTAQRHELLTQILTQVSISDRNGGLKLHTGHRQLANDVAYILHSLGGIATVYERNDKFEGDSYVVWIKSEWIVARSLKIQAIRKAPYRDNATCITVDHPSSMYVADNFIVTHNTACAMKSIVQIQRRVLFVTKAGYIDKWMGDLTAKKFSLSLRPGELVRVKSLQDLDDLIHIGQAKRLGKAPGEREVKMIAISSHTLDNWLQESLRQIKDCHFTELLETLGIGLVLYDETHQLFRMNYWSFLMLGAPRILDLSATLGDEGDDFMDRRYGERVPKSARYNGLKYDAYIDAYSIFYHSDKDDIVNRVNRLKMYNHTEFEKAIMRRKKPLKAYFKMVYDVMAAWYLKERQPGQKALIFFATKKMCTEYTEYVKERHPELDVKRYIQGDNYKEFINADIGISTPGKASTAIDIVGLVITLCTVAMGKEKANLQLLGRTRKVKDWDMSPKVVYFHCQQIKKHNVYLKRRREMFNGKVKSFRLLNSHFWI